MWSDKDFKEAKGKLKLDTNYKIGIKFNYISGFVHWKGVDQCNSRLKLKIDADNGKLAI
jgi:hypothetical protein